VIQPGRRDAAYCFHKWNKLYVTATLKVTVVVKPENAQCTPTPAPTTSGAAEGDSRYHGENSTNATSDFSTWWPLYQDLFWDTTGTPMHAYRPRIAKPGSPPFEKSNLVAPTAFTDAYCLQIYLHYRNQTRTQKCGRLVSWKRNWKGIAISHDISQGYSICVSIVLHVSCTLIQWPKCEPWYFVCTCAMVIHAMLQFPDA